MSNSKKPPVKPVVAPAKPVSVAPTPVAAAKPAAPAPAPVAKPAPVAVKPVAPAAVAPKAVEPQKPVVEAKPAPVVAAAPAPVAPAPKVAEPVKPVAVEKPVVVAKAPVETKPVAPKAPVAKPDSPKASKSSPEFPVMEFMKPMAALQENLRANTEKALGDFRGRYAEVKGIAESATTKLEDSLKAAQSGSREFSFKLFEIAKAQTQDHLDHAKTLAAAKTLPEFVSAQQAFVLAQFRVSQDRAKDVATLANKIANDVTAPLRASLSLFARR